MLVAAAHERYLRDAERLDTAWCNAPSGAYGRWSASAYGLPGAGQPGT